MRIESNPILKRDRKIEIYLNKSKEKVGRKLKKVILFGSRARGDDIGESDYDFVLIFDKVTLKTKRILNKLSAEILLEYGMVITDFAFAEKDLKRKKYNPLIMNVRKEGVLL